MLLFLLVFAVRIRLLCFVPTRTTRTCRCHGKCSFFGSSVFFGSEESIWSEITNPLPISYCAFHKHANSDVQKPASQFRFSLPSFIITITSNEPWNTETHKTDRNPLITDQSQIAEIKFCFLKAPLRWLTAAKTQTSVAFYDSPVKSSFGESSVCFVL